LAAFQNASAIRFNDNRASVQGLFFQFGDGVTGGQNTPIQFAAYSNSSAGSFANEIANRSKNSQITIGGVISSLPGTVTPIFFSGPFEDNSSVINLVNANTFVGDIGLLGGTLGIASDASLGNAANTLFLEVASITAGGLQFLNGGITVARPLVLVSPTRILSDGGTSTRFPAR
jgi:hypothetical protein